MRRIAPALAACLAALLVAAGGAHAQVQPYRAGDPGGFANILPPGSNGFVNAVQLGQFLANGTRQPHNDDQLAMYADLVYEAPNLKPEDFSRFFKDASFGVRPEDVERTYSPRPDVTIVRDKGFGVPHIYGTTRSGAMFGAGYAGAEDRLFFMDVLRNAGRAQLSSFAGGAAGNRKMDRDIWTFAPYTEADLQRQYDQFDDLYGAQGAIIQNDVQSYVAGINAYIREARANTFKLPGEYAAINRPAGPEDWAVTDVVATAALVGSIFGKGGGRELGSATVLQEAKERFGERRGTAVWRDFRSAEDPEAPTTVHRKRFPYETPPRKRARGSLALPDRGSVKSHEIVAEGSGSAAARSNRSPGIFGVLGGLEAAFPSSMSNALVVSARESESGHPIAIFGPQTGYFSPQVLMEMDIHAPAGADGPAIAARGVAFAGTNLYVQLGRGDDYSFSATAAGNDNIDTFALDLCEPGGGAPTLESMHYEFRGACVPIEIVERVNSWSPTPGDMTPAGSETLRAQRTKMGLVTARATRRGKPVIYTSLRTTYMHEVDSAGGFIDINDPDRINGPRDFQRAFHKVGYTFNWLYTDDRDIAYFNSGDNPVRARGTDPNFPVAGRFEWRNWNPDAHTASYTPFRQHPQVINQRYITSWNNKQAPAFRAHDGHFSWGPLDRVMTLDDRIVRGTRGPAKMSLVELVNAMEDAGTVDLRGDKVLRWGLKVIGRQSDPALSDAIAKLHAWRRDGAHRRDLDRDGSYEHSEAIAIMDAWWPLWVEAQFKEPLGEDLYDALLAIQRLHDDPHLRLGSAFDDGWYGFAQKDLRTVLGGRDARRVRGAWSRIYCGDGRLRECRKDLVASLRAALASDLEGQYRGDPACRAAGRDGDQTCWDAIAHRPVGGVTQPLIPWVNRPTFQQAVEIRGPRP